MEAIFLACGAGGPQLKRNPLDRQRPIRAMRAIFLTGLILLGCGPAIESLLPPYNPAPEPWPVRPHVIVSAIDPSLASLKLPPLAAVALPQTWREVRFSRGHGMILGAEYPVIRIVEQPGAVVGQVAYFHAVIPRNQPMPKVLHWSARVAKLPGPIDWKGLLRVLDSLGIETFEPPAYHTAIMDAGDLVVEVRHGTAYRAYEVNAPQLRPDTISMRAARIAHVVDSLERLTRGYD